MGKINKGSVDKNKWCNACEALKKNGSDFYMNGVTNAVCKALMDNKGFDPGSDRDNCEDLHDANDCLIANLYDELDAYDVCDWKEFMCMLIPNLYNMLEAMICSECGLWNHLAMDNIDVELRIVVNGTSSSASDSYSIARNGSFWFKTSDLISAGNPYAHIEIYGKVGYCFTLKSGNKLYYKISNNKLDRIKYTIVNTGGIASTPKRTFKIPNSSSPTIWYKDMNKSFDENVNKTVAINKEGTVNPGKDSGWITVMHQIGDWVIDESVDYQIRFVNRNRDTLPNC